MKLPDQTKDIFDMLSHGKFICENSPILQERKLYDVCERYQNDLYDYFYPLGFDLHHEEGYFYFSKKLQNTQIENKLLWILEYIDYIELMKQFSESFGVGWRGTPAQLTIAAQDNAVLKESINRLKGLSSSQSIPIRCKNIFEKFTRDGFMEVEDEEHERYIVLSSYAYLENFMHAIEVQNDEPAQ